MRFASVYLLTLLFFGWSAWAEPVSQLTRYCAVCGLLGVDTCASESGQFIVHAYPPPPFEDPTVRTNSTFFRLGPQFLAITAERTKRNFLQLLEVQDAFRGKIHIYISDRHRPEQPISIVTKQHTDGFEYLVGVPRYLAKDKLVKGLVQVLSLEYANRNSRRNSELPTWLVEGLTRELESSITPAFVGNRKPITIVTLGYDRLREARKFFQSNSCLSINELSFNNISKLRPGDDELERYQYSAQLLVHSLLSFPNGPVLFRRFLQGLPASFNWQTVFHEVYKSHFPTPLAFEKWWALTWVDFHNRREHQIWPRTVSFQKLQATLLTPLEFHSETNAIPETRQVNLTQLLNETDFELQKAVIDYKIQQLFFLSFFLAPDAANLAYRYQETMKNYIDHKSMASYNPNVKSPSGRQQRVLRNTLKELEALDTALRDLGSKPAQNEPEVTLKAQASR